MVSFISFCGFTVLPTSTASGAITDRVLVYPHVQNSLAWALALTLIGAALGLLQQVEVRRTFARRPRAGGAVVRGLVPRRLPAGWSTDPDSRVVHRPRSGVGGVPGRVPPRPAAGSSLPLRLAYSARARRR